eukprot:170696-Rhodomonas_salina.2
MADSAASGGHAEDAGSGVSSQARIDAHDSGAGIVTHAVGRSRSAMSDIDVRHATKGVGELQPAQTEENEPELIKNEGANRLGLELTVNEFGRLVVTNLDPGGMAFRSGQVTPGDVLVGFRKIDPNRPNTGEVCILCPCIAIRCPALTSRLGLSERSLVDRANYSQPAAAIIDELKSEQDGLFELTLLRTGADDAVFVMLDPSGKLQSTSREHLLLVPQDAFLLCPCPLLTSGVVAEFGRRHAKQHRSGHDESPSGLDTLGWA